MELYRPKLRDGMVYSITGALLLRLLASGAESEDLKKNVVLDEAVSIVASPGQASYGSPRDATLYPTG